MSSANAPSSYVPLTNPISNSAFGIITGRKATSYADSNVSTLYNKSTHGPASKETRNELLEFEPVYTMHKATHLEELGKKELPVLSCLNGLPARTAKQVMRIIRFAGWSRGETANEFMRGNANGSVALIVHGVLTVVNSGVETISSGALVCIRALSEEEAARQTIAGRIPGKVILATVEYKPELDAIDAKNGFTALMMALGEPVAARLREITSDQAESFAKWWKAELTTYAVAMATMVESTGGNGTQAYEQYAGELGLIPGQAGNVDLIKALLRRAFVMNVFPNGVVAADPKQLIVPLPTAGVQQTAQLTELARLQATAITNKFNAIIGGHAAVADSIIGRTPSGGLVGGSMDLIMWKI